MSGAEIQAAVQLLGLINSLIDFANRNNIAMSQVVALQDRARAEGRRLSADDLRVLGIKARDALDDLDAAIAEAENHDRPAVG